MPKRFSARVRSRVEAILPSNMSQKPATIRQISAAWTLPFMAKVIPVKPLSIPMYVRITV